MPAMEFSVVDVAYQKVRDAFAAKVQAAAEVELAAQELLAAQTKADESSAALAPLQEAYLAAVAELREAIQALSEL